MESCLLLMLDSSSMVISDFQALFFQFHTLGLPTFIVMVKKLYLDTNKRYVSSFLPPITKRQPPFAKQYLLQRVNNNEREGLPYETPLNVV